MLGGSITQKMKLVKKKTHAKTFYAYHVDGKKLSLLLRLPKNGIEIAFEHAHRRHFLSSSKF